MQRLLQDPSVVQQQISMMKESVTQEALSEDEQMQVKTMLSAQLGVAVDQVDDFLADLDQQPVSAQQREILQLFKNMLSGKPQPTTPNSAAPQPTATPPATTSAVDSSQPSAPSGFEWGVDVNAADGAASTPPQRTGDAKMSAAADPVVETVPPRGFEWSTVAGCRGESAEELAAAAAAAKAAEKKPEKVAPGNAVSEESKVEKVAA